MHTYTWNASQEITTTNVRVSLYQDNVLLGSYTSRTGELYKLALVMRDVFFQKFALFPPCKFITVMDQIANLIHTINPNPTLISPDNKIGL